MTNSYSSDGFDNDEASIELARTNARQTGSTDRVTFHLQDASQTSEVGDYDLVTAFECVHDMSDPLGAPRTMHAMAGKEGAGLAVDERVGDRSTAKGRELELMMYGWSVPQGLPVGMAERPSAQTGTIMRTDTLCQYAKEAGFRDVEVLPIENDFFRFYRPRE